MNFKKLSAVCLSVLLTFSVAGCGSKKEVEKKEITVYTSIESEYIPAYKEAFNKKYPDIEVNIVRDSTGVITAKLLAEKDNPQADVIWGLAASSCLILDGEKVLAEYKPQGIEKIDKRFVDSKNEIPHWVGTCLWFGIISANEEEGKSKNLPMPESFEDLIKPEYKGQIVMPNPGSSGTGYLLVSSWIKSMGEEKAWKYMDELHKNIKSYVHSGSAPTKTTATGEQFLGLGMDFESLRMQKNNPQLKTIFTKEDFGWDAEVNALVNKKEIKEEAKLFLDWAISKEAMDAYSVNRGLITYEGMDSKVEGYPQNVKDRLLKLDLSWMAENRSRIINEWTKRYGSSNN